jgi:peptidoglycan/xylan/chitin deacetylase (PgdA/CDA1 family)
MLRGACERAGLAIDRTILTLSKQSSRVTAFMFHAVGTPEDITGFHGDLPFHTPTVFKEFIKWLAEHATVISSGEIKAATSGHRAQRRKCAAALTFDDGFLDHYTTVFPLLRQYGMTGTFFIPTALVGRPGGATRAMIREMSDHGMTIGSHSVSHCKFSQCSRENARRELRESRAYLEDLTGRACEEIAYPYGHYNEVTQEETIQAGYQRAFAASPYTTLSNDFALPRIAIPDTLRTWRYDVVMHG